MKKVLRLFVLFALLASCTTNEDGNYQVEQAWPSGDMSVTNKGVTRWTGNAEIHTYQFSDMYYFSKHDEEGGSGYGAQPIAVRFNDGGTALVSGSIKFKLSSREDNQLMLHKDYKSYEKVVNDMIRQTVNEALMQTSTLMKAEESYSTRRSEFTSLAEEQVKRGIFETIGREVKVQDADGNEFIERSVSVQRDEQGNAIIKKPSPLNTYAVEVLQFVIQDIDFDETIDVLISKKKEAEQQRVVAKAQAERAKQDAITVMEQGKARIAKAKADEEVEKIKAVTSAQKNFEVAQLNKKIVEEQTKAELVKKEGEAKANRLLVSAGLTPLEKATIDKETAIGVAKEMSKINFPQMMIFGGGKGSPMDPFEAVGLEAFMKISKQVTKDAKAGN